MGARGYIGVEMPTAAKSKHARPAGGSDAEPGTWSWLKVWSGYVVTVLPYVSAALVLIPGLVVGLKFAILLLFAIFVVAVRIIHEKAGVEVTGMPQKRKRPGNDR
jgi:hypothetical protein